MNDQIYIVGLEFAIPAGMHDQIHIVDLHFLSFYSSMLWNACEKFSQIEICFCARHRNVAWALDACVEVLWIHDFNEWIIFLYISWTAWVFVLLIDLEAMKDACRILAVLMELEPFVLTKVSGRTGAAATGYRCSVFLWHKWHVCLNWTMDRMFDLFMVGSFLFFDNSMCWEWRWEKGVFGGHTFRRMWKRCWTPTLKLYLKGQLPSHPPTWWRVWLILKLEFHTKFYLWKWR